jgi:hypothetical protein
MKKILYTILIGLFVVPAFVLSAPTTSYFRNLFPEANNTYDMGSTTLRWRNGFFATTTSGCFTTNGTTCITGGDGSGTVNSGTSSQVAFYNANGSTISGTSTISIAANRVGIGTAAQPVVTDIMGRAFSTTSSVQTGLAIDSSAVTPGIGNVSAGLEFTKLGSGTVKKAGIAIVQETADDDDVGMAFYVSDGSALVAAPVIEAMRIRRGGNVGISASSPNSKLDVGGQISGSALSGFQPTANISNNADAITGVEMRNANTGTNADFRFMVSDTTNNYVAFSQPSINNTSTILGQARNTASFIFNAGGTVRNLAVGTVGAKDFIVGTNNAERMRVLSAGNVGIGITTPSTLLHVRGLSGGQITAESTGTTDYAMYNIKATNREWRMGVGGGSETLFNVANKWFLFDNSVEQMRLVVDTSGNLGVGTAVPTSKLTVMGNVDFGINNKFYTVADFAGTGELPAGVLLGTGGTQKDFTIAPATDSGLAGAKLVFGYNNGSVWNSALEYANVASGATNLLLMKSGGNVGIGTSTPDFKLTVNTGGFVVRDTTTNLGQVSVTSNARQLVVTGVPTNTTFTGAPLVINPASSGAVDRKLIGVGFNNVERFSVDVEGDTFINGRLGLGTTTPTAKLAVTGEAGTVSPFLVASSTNARLFEIDAYGHIMTGGSAPSVSSCGTSPSVSGNDTAGVVTVGSGSVTSCVITFAVPRSNVPRHVSITPNTAMGIGVSAMSTSSVTVEFASSLGSGSFSYFIVE